MADDLQGLVDANRAIQKLSAKEVASLWASLDLGNPVAVKATLLDVLPEIVAKYGDMAALLAADLYDEWRATANARGRFNALMADLAPHAEVQASTRYAIGGLFRDPIEPEAVLTLLTNDVVGRRVANQGRDTIALNIKSDPARPRWARIPVGVTCEWCLMLGSRGFRPGLGYRSELTAAASSHGNCDCVIAPEWATGDLVDNYDPTTVYGEWQAARAARIETSRQ